MHDAWGTVGSGSSIISAAADLTVILKQVIRKIYLCVTDMKYVHVTSRDILILFFKRTMLDREPVPRSLMLDPKSNAYLC